MTSGQTSGPTKGLALDKEGRGLVQVVVNGTPSVEARFRSRCGHAVLPVQWMQAHQGQARPVAIGDLGQIWVDVRTGGAPRGRHFLDQDRGARLDGDRLTFLDHIGS